MVDLISAASCGSRMGGISRFAATFRVISMVASSVCKVGSRDILSVITQTAGLGC